nr:hypothetical protein [uncultured Flavobacterium sp.]
MKKKIIKYVITFILFCIVGFFIFDSINIKSILAFGIGFISIIVLDNIFEKKPDDIK